MAVEFQQATLDNGMTIVCETDSNAHSSAIGYFFRTGARDEDPVVMGVSHFLEHMMFKGTETRTAEQVNMDFDNIGASNNAFTTSELTAYYAHVLPEYVQQANEILSDILRPSLRPEDLEEERGVILEEIAMYEDHPFWRLYERAMEEHYGEHPLSHRVLGTKETVSALKRDQMQEYFSRRYSADNTIISASGNICFDRLCDQIEMLCGSWESTGTKREYPGVCHDSRTIELVDPKLHQSYALLLVTAPGVRESSRHAAIMVSHLLGHHEGSHLFWSLVEPGLAEDAQSQYDGRDGNGEILVHATCEPESMEKVIDQIRDCLSGFMDRLTDDEIEMARNRIATGVTLAGESTMGRMNRLGYVWSYLDEYVSLENELERISSLDRADLVEYLEEFPLEPKLIGTLCGEQGSSGCSK